MGRLALFTVVAVVLSVMLQTGRASAKLCQPELRFAPSPPVAGQETTLEVSIRSLDNEHEFDDPLCAIEAPPKGESALRLYLVPPGMPNAYAAVDFRQPGAAANLPEAENGHVSYEYLYPDAGYVDLERITPWRHQARVTFPREGSWQLSLERLDPEPTTYWRDTIEVAPAPALPTAGFGDEGAGAHTSLLAYALAAAGGAALFIGRLTRILGRRS